jgi:hypothetical protein
MRFKLSMNIRTDLTKRIKDVLKMVSTPPLMTVKGSVQTTIDYHKLVENYNYLSGSSIAGNVTTTITTNTDEELKILFGHIFLNNDGTAASRKILLKYTDKDGNVFFGLRSTTAITASQDGDLVIAKVGREEDITFTGLAIEDHNHNVDEIPAISNQENIEISITAGVAGDEYSYRFKTLNKIVPKEF